MTRARWISAFATAGLLVASVDLRAPAQEPVPSPTSQVPNAHPSDATSTKKTKHTHAQDFLVLGTVFTPEGLSFPGAELKIRRSAEKKFRWKTYTNSRGEFAVRVPQGADYEITVRAKGFAEQKRALDAKADREDSLVFHMEALTGKTGGKS